MSGGKKPLGDAKNGLAPLLNFRVAHEQAERLDRFVKETGQTRSDVVRAALDRYLAEEVNHTSQAS